MGPPPHLRRVGSLARISKSPSLELLQQVSCNCSSEYLHSRRSDFACSYLGIGQTPSLFGQPQQTQSAFGAKPIGFTQPTTSTPSAFGFGQPTPQTQTSLFGQPQQAKPFGTGTSIFGAPTTSQPSTGFGTQQTPTSTFGFGTQQQQAPSLFGAAKPAFGAPTSTTGFGFPQTTTTTSTGTSLFGAKPATGFGATPTPAFGAAPAQTTQPAFGGFGSGTGLFGGTTAQTPFGAKPAAPLTFGTATSTAPTLGFGQTSTSSMFGATTGASPAKPLFGTATGFGGTTGFGSSTGFGSTPLGGAGIGGATTTPSLFGTATTGAAPFGSPQTAAGAPGSGQLPIHQYILTLSEISQSSDHPLFRKMLEPSGKTEEVIKSSARPSLTNGAAPTPPQYRISPMPSGKIRTKALLNGSATAGGGRRSIFEGMSDEEEGEEVQEEAKTDFFVPRRSVKKLQLKAVSLDTTVEAESEKRGAEAESVVRSRDTPGDETPAALETRSDARGREDLDDSVAVLKIRRPTVAFLNQSTSSHREDHRNSFLEETGVGDVDETVAEEISGDGAEDENIPPHPAGIVLRRCGYSTIPSMEDLAVKGLDDEGRCMVSSFTILRQNYGQIYFEGPLNVANLNLDEIGRFYFLRHLMTPSLVR